MRVGDEVRKGHGMKRKGVRNLIRVREGVRKEVEVGVILGRRWQ